MPDGRPNTSPKYPSSTLARCLTRPSSLVPVAVSGRRMSYSDSPSSFHKHGLPGHLQVVKQVLLLRVRPAHDRLSLRPGAVRATRRR